MWLRLRLDIGWRDLIRGFCGSLIPGDRPAAQRRLEADWSAGRNDALACLSVRSGLDLLLRSLQLPAGSEILFSAVTIRDMPRIASELGFTPIPVDVCGSDCRIDVASLRRAITPRSRVLVVAHLFGARPDLAPLRAIAQAHNLFLVEDCAQAWCDPGWRGSDGADASLFSFGTIKTATALGGALCRVSDPQLLARMRDLQDRQPVQAADTLAFRSLKMAALKAVSARAIFGGMAAIGRRFGMSVDDLLGGLTRGFSEQGFFDQLRRQPSLGLLRMLRHRLRTYDPRRVSRRIDHAKRIIDRLSLDASQPELRDSQHSFWLFPMLTDHAALLIPYLREQGFDTTQRGRLETLPPPEDRPWLACPQAARLLDRLVFLPCYPEMTEAAIDRMCRVIQEFRPHRDASGLPAALPSGTLPSAAMLR